MHSQVFYQNSRYKKFKKTDLEFVDSTMWSLFRKSIFFLAVAMFLALLADIYILPLSKTLNIYNSL